MSAQLELPFVDPPPGATVASPTAAEDPASPAGEDPAVRTARLQRRAHEATAAWVARARATWPEAAFRFPRIVFRLRGRSAGEACADTWTLNYNQQLLERYEQDFLDELVPHEVAHLVVAALHRGRVKPHGPEWREVMRRFGIRARATHGFETTPARRVARVPYRCGCGREHLLTVRAHRRIRRGTREYVCRKCREILRWAGEEAGPAGSTP